MLGSADSDTKRQHRPGGLCHADPAILTNRRCGVYDQLPTNWGLPLCDTLKIWRGWWLLAIR
jgi:hypothetical protein